MRKLFFVALLVSSMLIPTVYGYDYFYNIMPGKGRYDEEFLIWVRVDPRVETSQMSMQVFWDHKPITARIMSPRVGKTASVTHMWDLMLEPPVNYRQIGKHDIEIWLEPSVGNVKILTWQYTITDGVSDLDSWEEFLEIHPEYLEQIRGPIGPIGFDGARGKVGNTGDQGPRGNVGEPGPVGSVGPIGEPGLVGPVGPKGADASYLSMIIIGAISCVASILITRFTNKKRSTS